MSMLKRTIFLITDILLITALVFADRYTKGLAVRYLKDKDPIKLIPGVFELRYLENKGAAFGMLQDMRTLFLVVGGIFVVMVLYLLIRIPATAKYRPLRICLILLGAGAVGNLIDRFSTVYVIDFLYFIYIDFPIFNVADIYVTVSAAALVILLLFIYKDDDLDLKKANKVKLHSSMLPETDADKADEDQETERSSADIKSEEDTVAEISSAEISAAETTADEGAAQEDTADEDTADRD